MIAIVAVLVMLAVGLAALGLLIVSGILLVKLAPVLLVVWLATRVIRGNRQTASYRIVAPREQIYGPRGEYSPDDAWLDTRG
ncbi:MAG TPA: hypothetical protein VFH27_04560 [Longimicrobiaceae bacterium]|nr:hypothetical protein [Longimicrobiaceae bacterium]